MSNDQLNHVIGSEDPRSVCHSAILYTFRVFPIQGCKTIIKLANQTLLN